MIFFKKVLERILGKHFLDNNIILYSLADAKMAEILTFVSLRTLNI